MRTGRDIALNMQRWFGDSVLTQHLAAICFILRKCAPQRLDEFELAVTHAPAPSQTAPPSVTSALSIAVLAAQTTIGTVKQSHGTYVTWCDATPDDTAAFNLQRLAYTLVGIDGTHTPTPPTADSGSSPILADDGAVTRLHHSVSSPVPLFAHVYSLYDVLSAPCVCVCVCVCVLPVCVFTTVVHPFFFDSVSPNVRFMTRGSFRSRACPSVQTKAHTSIHMVTCWKCCFRC